VPGELAPSGRCVLCGVSRADKAAASGLDRAQVPAMGLRYSAGRRRARPRSAARRFGINPCAKCKKEDRGLIMKRSFVVLTLAAMAASWAAQADAPKTLHVIQSVVIKAPVDKVWAAVKDFDSLGKWHPAVASDEIIKGTNNKPGAVRKLSIKDGPSLTEQLVAFNETTHSFKYKILESPFPVTHYLSTLTVKAHKGDTTVVTWVGTFTRKNPAENPPEAENDAAATKLITGIYHDGLANLKKQNEG
jgi:mxaD protein